MNAKKNATLEPVTESQHLYCYMRRYQEQKRKPRPVSACDAALRPWAGPVLTFFTIPSLDPDAGLRAKLGFWQYHGAGINSRIKEYNAWQRGDIDFSQFRAYADRPFGTSHYGSLSLHSAWAEKHGGFAQGRFEEGVFFNPALCTPEEIETIKAFAEKNMIGRADLKGFVHCVLSKAHMVKGGGRKAWERKLICADGLANELGAISSEFVTTKDRKGFTLEFCDCKKAMARGEARKCDRHLKVSVKNMGGGFSFSPQNLWLNDFLDLEQASKVLGLEDKLPCRPDAERTIDKDSLKDWRAHSAKVFKAHQTIRNSYREYNLDIKMNHLYSGASLAKGVFRAMGIKPFMAQKPDFDPHVLGKFAAAMLGARTENKLDGVIAEVAHLDFSGQYPTIFTLMGLQKIHIANCVEARHNDPSDFTFLRSLSYESLFVKDTWKHLAGIALIRPGNDVLSLGHDLETVEVVSGPPMWVTFADVSASRVLTGRTPEIIETISLVPHGVQEGLKPHDLFGREDYRIDPVTDDIFMTMAKVRDSAKSEGRNAVADSIKQEMNTGAFGVFGQTIIDTRETRKPLAVYCAGRSVRLAGNRMMAYEKPFPIEDPGEFYSPIAPLIIGGGRLLLAMLEKAGADRELDYAACDTDAMIFIRPNDAPNKDFQKHIESISTQFEAISPYDGAKPFLKIEDRCYSLRNKEKLEPLFFLGRGFKSYAEFNVNRNGTPVIRHLAVIGLGDIRKLPEYDPEAHEFTAGDHPAGCGDDVCNATAARLIMALWRHVIRLHLNGEEGLVGHDLGSIPALKTPAFSTLDVLYDFDTKIYKKISGIRPFMPLVRVQGTGDRSFIATGPAAWHGSFIYPDDKNCLFDRDTGEIASRPRMWKLRERITEHFRFDDQGIIERRRISIGRQFVAPKGKRAIKPEDDNLEAEPELGLLDFCAIFELTKNGLAGVGEPGKGPVEAMNSCQEHLDKLEAIGLLDKFLARLAGDGLDTRTMADEEFARRAKLFQLQSRIPSEAQKRGREAAAKSRRFNFVNNWMNEFFIRAATREYEPDNQPGGYGVSRVAMTHAEAEQAALDDLAREDRERERLKKTKQYAKARSIDADALRKRERLKKATWRANKKPAKQEATECTAA